MKTYKEIREENTRPTEGLLPEDEPVTVDGDYFFRDDNGRRWVVPIYWQNGQAVSNVTAFSPELFAAHGEAEEQGIYYDQGKEVAFEEYIERIFAREAGQ